MNKEIPTCIAVANRIINRTNAQNVWRLEQGKSRVQLFGKRLQKLLYLCQLFWYIDHEESMIKEDFQAWPNGPVIPEIHDYWSVYQDGDMAPVQNVTYTLSEEETDIINRIVDNTMDISTETIIDYTHLPDGPWAETYRDYQGVYSVISKDSIRQYINIHKHQRELLDFIQKKVTYKELVLAKKLTLPRNIRNK